MPNEITVTWSLSAVKGNLTVPRGKPRQDKYDMAGDGIDRRTQAIPTTAGGTQITIDSTITTLGECSFENLDTGDPSTNWVLIGIKTGGVFYPMIKVRAGKSCPPIDLSAITPSELYAISSVGTVLIAKNLLEL